MTVESRGTSNTNARGSAESRRARRAYLFEAYAADKYLVFWTYPDGREHVSPWPVGIDYQPNPDERVERCVRCYRCGKLLTDETMEVDRIKPGCKGGTYARENIRPVCECCNKITGNIAKAEKAAKRKKRNAQAKVRRDAKKAKVATEKILCQAIVGSWRDQ